MDLEADDLAAEQIQDDVQIPPLAEHGTGQVIHIPAKRLARAGCDMRARRTSPLRCLRRSPMTDLPVGAQNATEAGFAGDIDAFVCQHRHDARGRELRCVGGQILQRQRSVLLLDECLHQARAVGLQTVADSQHLATDGRLHDLEELDDLRTLDRSREGNGSRRARSSLWQSPTSPAPPGGRSDTNRNVPFSGVFLLCDAGRPRRPTPDSVHLPLPGTRHDQSAASVPTVNGCSVTAGDVGGVGRKGDTKTNQCLLKPCALPRRRRRESTDCLPRHRTRS